MSKKKGNFIDQYLDKIILGLTAAAALYLMWAFVLSNPYGQKVGNQKLSPSEIDSVNQRQARQIQDKLADPLEKTAPYTKNKAVELSKKIDCPMPQISIAANWPLPGGGQTGAGEDRQYVIPQIPAMENVKYASFRGTVRMPTEDVTPEVSYSSVASKPQDLDLVTLSAKLNLQALYDNFRQSFMGMRLKPQWRDPMLAEPVIGRIELQRRAQKEDGSWADWETVGFTRIDPYKKTIRDIPLTTEKMTYGNVELFMNSCKEFSVMKDILQPPIYDFLSTQTKWLPAQFQQESQKISEEQDLQKMKEERDRRQKEKTGNPNRPGGNVPQNRPGGNAPQTRPGGGMGGAENPRNRQPGGGLQPGGRGGRGGRGDNNPMEGLGGGLGMPVKPAKPVRTVQDIERDATAAKIDEKTKINTLKELLVWVHDDTVTAGVTYQYRIRAGVFNPIAGKEWFAPESKQYKNQILLWSNYTEIAESVKIPKMLQMFPIDVLSDGTGVAIDVFKYYMGQWHTQSFDVHFGQMIGKKVESKPKPGAEGMNPGAGMPGAPMGGFMMENMAGGASQISEVDFSTGCMLMDVQVRTDWMPPSIRSQTVSNMLYLDDQNQVLTLATKKSNCWPKELNAEYNTVKSEASKSEGVSMEGEGFAPGMPNRVQGAGGGR
jgi:hypothetical protein